MFGTFKKMYYFCGVKENRRVKQILCKIREK